MKAAMKAACIAHLIAAAAAYPYIAGPANQSVQAAWLAELYAQRAAQRASVKYTTEVYDNYLPWSPSLHIAPQVHVFDRFLYNPALATANPADGWTVERFLDDFDERYGGVDGVLLWGTYPNLGVDERSQFDLVGDVPGGLAALKDVVARFHARGVRVGVRVARRSESVRACSPLRRRYPPSPHCRFLTILGTRVRHGAMKRTRPSSRSSRRPWASIS